MILGSREQHRSWSAHVLGDYRKRTSGSSSIFKRPREGGKRKRKHKAGGKRKSGHLMPVISSSEFRSGIAGKWKYTFDRIIFLAAAE